MPPRCRLRSLFTAPGVAISGYDADGVLEAREDGLVIGRLASADLTIVAMIGGRNTYRVTLRDDSWTFQVKNEWANANVNGTQLPGAFPQCVLHDGDTVDLLAISGEVVHRFRVELG
jgi:hypothetical protein